MSVKSFAYCSVTALAIAVGALLNTAPASAQSTPQTQTPILHVETGACVDPGMNEGTIGVDVTNDSPVEHTYKVIVDGTEKELTVAANSTEYIEFTDLAAGTYTVTLIAPDDIVYTDTATITECHEGELPIVEIATGHCAFEGECTGSLDISITNPNDYDVTYTVRVGFFKKDVFVGAKETQSVTFNHLTAGDYAINVSGDDCTSLCLTATIEQCPEEEPEPEQPGQGGGTPTPTPTPTAPTTPAAPAAVAQPAALPVVLPDTSATEPAATTLATAQPSKTTPHASLLALTLGGALLAYAGARRARELEN